MASSRARPNTRQYSEAQAGAAPSTCLPRNRQPNAARAMNTPSGSSTVTAMSSQSVLKPTAASATLSAPPASRHANPTPRPMLRAPLRTTNSAGSTVMVASPKAWCCQSFDTKYCEAILKLPRNRKCARSISTVTGKTNHVHLVMAAPVRVAMSKLAGVRRPMVAPSCVAMSKVIEIRRP